jgi:hypothetical protein
MGRLLLAATILGSSASALGATTPTSEFPMKIRLQVDGEVAIATLYDNASARDFASLLPLSLTLEDYAVIERISDLPRKLSTVDAAEGMTPQAGDITYYAPWGNLAIFTRGNVHARGLLPLGKVESGLPVLQRPGPFHVSIERIED